MDYVNFDNENKLAERFKMNYPELTTFQALELAIQKQRNQILIAAHAVSASDSHPSALEKIAMELHGVDRAFDEVREAVKDISNLMDEE